MWLAVLPFVLMAENLPECKSETDKQKDYKTIANTIQTFAIIGMTQSYEREIMAKDTKERILKVATELFAKKGYAGTSIRDIAKCANVNLSMISYYFNNKEGLYQAVLTQHIHNPKSVIQTLKDAKNPKEAFEQILTKIPSLHDNNPYLAKLIISEFINPTPIGQNILQETFQSIYEVLTHIMQQGIESGEFRDDLDTHSMIFSLGGILHFYLLTKYVYKTNLPLTIHNANNTTLLQHIFEIFLYGVKAPNDPK